jgi:hypothetical protein
MIPTVDNNHVAEGQALLTSMFVDKAVIKGIVTALMLRLQDIETSYWALINDVQLANHPLPGPTSWSILDQLGAIVGASRDGLDDPDYLALIKLQIQVNRSRGNPDDILALAAIMLGSTPGHILAAKHPLPVYVEYYPAAFYLGCWDLAGNFPLFVPLLTQIRPAAVLALLAYTTWPDGGDLVWGSSYDSSGPADNATGWGSVYDSTAGGVWVAGLIF